MNQSFVNYCCNEYEVEKKYRKMNQFFVNPGLSHIGENIALQLDHNALLFLKEEFNSFQFSFQYNILKTPQFWLKKCSPILDGSWKEFAQEIKTYGINFGTHLEDKFVALLIKIHEDPAKYIPYLTDKKRNVEKIIVLDREMIKRNRTRRNVSENLDSFYAEVGGQKFREWMKHEYGVLTKQDVFSHLKFEDILAFEALSPFL